jgi:hypothetical protein
VETEREKRQVRRDREKDDILFLSLFSLPVASVSPPHSVSALVCLLLSLSFSGQLLFPLLLLLFSSLSPYLSLYLSRRCRWFLTRTRRRRPRERSRGRQRRVNRSDIRKSLIDRRGRDLSLRRRSHRVRRVVGGCEICRVGTCGNEERDECLSLSLSPLLRLRFFRIFHIYPPLFSLFLSIFLSLPSSLAFLSLSSVSLSALSPSLTRSLSLSL